MPLCHFYDILIRHQLLLGHPILRHQRTSLSYRAVCHHWNLMFPLPRDQIILNATTTKIVQHLVHTAVSTVRNPHQIFHILYIKIRYTPPSDFSLLFTNPGYFFGGFVFYGGLIGGVFGAWLYCWQFRLRLFDYANLIVTAIPIIHGIGRIGCFCAGCCYGKPMDPPLGLLFNASPVAPHDVYLFPVQLLEVFTNLIIFVILMVYTNKKSCPRHGGLALYMCWYAVTRFLIEFLRYDDVERGFIGFLSTSQFISLFILAGGILLFIKGGAIVRFFDRTRPVKKKRESKAF